MPARIDPFIDVLLREKADQLYLLPDEPVTMLKDGKSRKVTKQPLTDQHIYALLVEVAPSESADHIDQMAETEFEYLADRGMVRVRIVPEGGRLTAVVVPIDHATTAGAAPAPAAQAPQRAPGGAVAAAPAPVAPAPSPPPPSPAPPAPPRPAARGAARQTPAPAAPSPVAAPPTGLPLDFAAPQYKAAERTLGELLQLAIMPERNRTEWKETGDSDFAYEIAGLARFRVNAARDRKGPLAVFRVIPAQVVTAEQLGLSKEVQQLCYLTKGLVLVTGPTGSGKSTTLCALIDLINRTRTDHIITIEDPIEFVHENKQCVITQRQVGVHTEGFKRALRAALREDPDIVLVGEMRDLETIAIAIETAETGHLVFGTLHTTTAASTVDRIIDQFPADRQSQIRVMLSESLKGVISQTLCKKVAGGRIAAREILLTTPAIANLIREGKTFQIPSIIQTSKQLGMLTLNDALLELVEKKEISPDEAYVKSVEKAGLAASLKAKGHKLTITA